MKPIVGADLCQAFHQLFIVSGRLHFLTEEGAEVEVGPGDTVVVVPPGHDAWVVVGDEPCESFDLSPDYSKLIEAGEAYLGMTPSDASTRLRDLTPRPSTARTSSRRSDVRAL